MLDKYSTTELYHYQLFWVFETVSLCTLGWLELMICLILVKACVTMTIADLYYILNLSMELYNFSPCDGKSFFVWFSFV